ncbi:hypothetical protein SY88_18650 [Clostridiales bacterium PH28_bin88]|nr:hypothetical protein SY88_18650 [Clostridiales bacterium PH28_bin88]
MIIPSRRAAASVPLTGLVHQAYLDWVNAQRFFAEVSDPDLVDEAVYLVNAAEKRYIYLLKQARKAEVGQGIPARLT